jgi:DnaJ-class molecular chaperone
MASGRRNVIVYIDCPRCHGLGKQHSPGHTGDPMDYGVACERCEGAGVIEADPADEIEDWMRD